MIELIREVSPADLSLDDFVAQLGLDALTERGFRLSSTGERRRLMLARALVQFPKLLIFDEPCLDLDSLNRSSFKSVIPSETLQ